MKNKNLFFDSLFFRQAILIYQDIIEFCGYRALPMLHAKEYERPENRIAFGTGD